MKIRILFILLGIFVIACKTKQPVTIQVSEPVIKPESMPVKQKYEASYVRHVDLIHTRLNISLDWKKKQLIGQAAIIFRPYFYPIDSLFINARGMELQEVAFMSSNGRRIPLKYNYDSLMIRIRLDRTYTKEESFTVFISYISKPENLKSGRSSGLTDDKGLYFIDADSSDIDTPTQVWTQGETEFSSVWFPTIEDPSQRMTQEIYFTVDTAFTTLSNGLLISTTENNNGTKTDYWKQSLPAAPYLTMIAAGKFSVVTDRWKNIEVSYYVDPAYEKYARMIFGITPEMITFFSDKLETPYVWEKYSQVVVHEFVTGAMENTTAVIHGTNMQQDPREFHDRNYEYYISHELLHHWFGNLVTCESWSNIALNESFANYGEYLWIEYKYSQDEADLHIQSELASYLSISAQYDPPLIRFNYEDKETLYDAISYNKGGRILHMLRKYVGDDAFFASLKLYLSTNMFSSVEYTDLRLAFEKITGEDLNWFFDQWFLKGGHPTINIDYNWNDSLHFTTVSIRQKQDFDKNPLYRLPLNVDIYYSGKVERKKIIVDQASQDFQFNLPVKPDLVNVDADKVLLSSMTENKTNEELIFQYEHAPLYIDRYEAVSKIGGNYKVNTPEARLMMKALHDKFYFIRLTALNNISEIALNDTGIIKSELRRLALYDSSADVREKALFVIGKNLSYTEFSQLFSDALKDSSYKVVARAFKVISEKDIGKAKSIAVQLEKDSSDAIFTSLAEYYSTFSEDKISFYKKAIRLSKGRSRYYVLRFFSNYLKESPNPSIITKGIDIIFEKTKKSNSKNYRSALVNAIKDIESSVKNKINTGEKELEEINDSILKTEKLSRISELKSLRNKLNEKLALMEK